LKISIVHSEADFFAIDKPAGVLSQKDRTGDADAAALLKNELEKKGQRVDFLAPVHRLDRNTSGLLLLARTKNGAAELTEILKERSLKKIYLAVAKGDPGEKGDYVFPLKKDNAENQVYEDECGLEAHTEFRRLQKLGNSSLMEILLHTGRPHQIRAHFSLGGHALLGDKKYGKKPWSEIFSRPALHAFRLELPWRGDLLKLQAPLPQDMQELLQKLGGRIEGEFLKPI
jgi:RluA family pseudouridine synthase